MEAPFDAAKSKEDMFNFSGSAGDMMEMMKAAGIVAPEAQEAARKVAAAPASEAEASCADPSCGHDHSHGSHAHEHGEKTAAAPALGEVDSLEAFNAAVQAQASLAVVFFAEWSTPSEKLATFVEKEVRARGGGTPFLKLDLGDSDVEAFALDLGVSEPGTVFFYRGGAKVSELKGAAATEASVASALATLLSGSSSTASCVSSECTDHGHSHAHAHGHASTAPAATAATAANESERAAETSTTATVVELVDASDSSVLLAWRNVAKAVKYELAWRPAAAAHEEEGGGEGEGWAKLGSKGFGSGLPPKQKSGLLPNSCFEFKVRARDGVDWFPWGPVSQFATLSENAKRLPPVTLLKAEQSCVTVQWTAPEEEEADALPSPPTFELQMREAGDAGWSSVAKALKGTVARKRNLDPAGGYSFRVKPNTEKEAEGKGGEGWSFSAPNPIEFKAAAPVSPFFRDLLGSTLLTSGTSSGGGFDRLAGCVVAVYFSASWCPPCRQFTPTLATFYTQAKAQGLKFEVVFVSNDKEEASMLEYFGHMPWLAVPFDAPQRTASMQRFQVNGIPHLKVFNSFGQVVDDNAVSSGALTHQNVAAWASGKTVTPPTPPAHQHKGGGGC